MALSLAQVVRLDDTPYTVTDVLLATYRSGRPEDRWFVLQAPEGLECLLRERDNRLVLFTPDGAGPRPPAPDRVRFASSAGGAARAGIHPYADDGATVRIGETTYHGTSVELDDDDVLHRVEDVAAPMRAADYVTLAVAPIAGVAALFVTRFSFVTTLLVMGTLAALARKIDRTLGATYHSLAASLAAFLALTPLTLQAGLWGVHQDIVATVLVIFSIPIAVHYPILRLRLAAAALPTAAAAALPFLALLGWCLLDEDWSWWRDWPRWYRYGSWVALAIYLIALTRTGRRWLRETASDVLT